MQPNSLLTALRHGARLVPSRARLVSVAFTASALPLAAQLRIIDVGRTADHGLPAVSQAFFDSTRNVLVLRNGATVRQYDGAGRIGSEADGDPGGVSCPYPSDLRDRLEFSIGSGTRRYTNGAWQTVAGLEPPRRPGTAYRIALDTQRQRALLSVQPTSGLNEYWEFDGSIWLMMSTMNVPALQMAYDAGRGRTVVLGGDRRHWEWDGRRWSDLGIVVGTSDTVRGLTYDARRRRIVALFDVQSFVPSIYEYTPSGWSITQVNLPSITQTAIAYDELRAKTYIFGTTAFGPGVWTWDGSTIAAVSATTTHPGRRNDAMMAPVAGDSLTQPACMLFGGSDQNGIASDETWLWDTNGWSPWQAAQRPPARIAGAMAQSNGVDAVLYGGLDASSTVLSDTWRFNRQLGWQPVLGATSGGRRYNHAMAYYPQGRVTYLHGGYDGTTALGDLRWLDESSFPARWRSVIAPNPPPARFIHAMACDVTRQRLVVFGGLDVNQVALNDTWELDLVGGSWTNRSGSVRPSARVNHALVWDHRRGHCVLIGGYEWNTGAFLNDVWEWNGDVWQQRALETTTLPGTENLAAAEFAATGDIVTFGGFVGGGAGASDATLLVQSQAVPSALAQNFPFQMQVTGRPAQSGSNTMPLKVKVPGLGGVLVIGFAYASTPVLTLAPPTTCVSQPLFVYPTMTLSVPQSTELVVPMPVGLTGISVGIQALTFSPANCWSLTDAWILQVGSANP